VGLQNKPSMDAVEKNFALESKEQKTTPTDGILLNKEAARIARATSTRFRLALPESFGLLKNGTEQIYEKIVWNIKGRTSDNKAVEYSGEVLKTEAPNQMLKADYNNINYTYYYDFPQDVMNGSYTIVIQFYRELNGAPETLSLNYLD